MSFNVSLNSVDGTQIVGGVYNQIEYNFAFDKTPEHKGGYKVSFAFSSLVQAVNPFIAQSEDIYVNVNLGVCNSYTPRATFTGTQNNQLLGVVNAGQVRQQSIQTQVNIPTATGVASIPVNSATDAYTLTTNTTSPSAGVFYYFPINHSYDAFFTDNKPIYLTSKPTNNQFVVTLTKLDGTLFTNLTTHYTLLISFEAV
jgi:hypothetical protein